MTRSIRILALGFGAVVGVGPALAHHSDRMVDGSTPVWLTGTVVRYELINPHAMLYLEVTDTDGRTLTWTVEGPNLRRFEVLGMGRDAIKAGDEITICGFYPITEALAARPKPQFIHGKILITPDGQKWAWGPYGRLKNCVSENEWDTIATGTNPLRP